MSIFHLLKFEKAKKQAIIKDSVFFELGRAILCVSGNCIMVTDGLLLMNKTPDEKQF